MEDEDRKIGAHVVITENTSLHQAVVVIHEGRVVNYYEFHDELPMVEWLGGTIVIKRNDDGILQAFQDGKLLTT
nr:hypothetical protein [Prevotella sp.]